MGLNKHSSVRSYFIDSIKEHWILWSLLSTAIAISSFFKVDPTNDIPGWIFYLVFFLFFAFSLFCFVALHNAVTDVEELIFKDGFQPRLADVKHVFQPTDAVHRYKVIVNHKDNVSLPNGTMICVHYKDLTEEIVGLGKVTKTNSDGSIELAVTSVQGAESRWNEICEIQEKYKNILITCVIPDHVLPGSLDEYIEHENREVQALNEGSENLETDGEGVRV